MRRNKCGRIINIASAHGLVASPFKSAYVAAKHGIVGLTKVTALETAEDGITCNAICPGYVYTPLVEAQIDGQAKAHGIPREQVIRDVLLAQQPNKRFATVEEIGALTVFLASRRGRLDHRHRPAGRRRLDGALSAVHERPRPMDRIPNDHRPTASRHIRGDDPADAVNASAKPSNGQIVLVLQGGGALGAYQAGVYQALHEAGIEPDWIIGTSIGAINASLIAGNAVADRLARLKEFWHRIERPDLLERLPGLDRLPDALSNWTTLATGIPGFFEPNPLAFLGSHVPLGSDAAGYYSTEPLSETLGELVDFVAHQHVQAAPHRRRRPCAHQQMHYFDSRDMTSTPTHIMASGALPPAFPRGAHRRRALLGRRHPFQHADRGGVRRQSAPELADLRRAYVESEGRGARTPSGR